MITPWSNQNGRIIFAANKFEKVPLWSSLQTTTSFTVLEQLRSNVTKEHFNLKYRNVGVTPNLNILFRADVRLTFKMILEKIKVSDNNLLALLTQGVDKESEVFVCLLLFTLAQLRRKSSN